MRECSCSILTAPWIFQLPTRVRGHFTHLHKFNSWKQCLQHTTILALRVNYTWQSASMCQPSRYLSGFKTDDVKRTTKRNYATISQNDKLQSCIIIQTPHRTRRCPQSILQVGAATNRKPVMRVHQYLSLHHLSDQYLLTTTIQWTSKMIWRNLASKFIRQQEWWRKWFCKPSNSKRYKISGSHVCHTVYSMYYIVSSYDLSALTTFID